MKEKKSFVFFDDLLDAIVKMTPEEAKQYMLAIRSFRMGNDVPTFEDRFMQDKFEKAISLISSADERYKAKCERLSQNFAKRRANEEQKQPNEEQKQPNEPQKETNAELTVTETETETENDTDNNKPVVVKEEEKKKKTYKPFTPDLSFIPEHQEAWAELLKSWLAYKKDRKESYKNQQSVEVCYRNLLNLSSKDYAKACQIVEQSMANNWAGLFELKEEGNGANRNYTQYQRRLNSEQQLGRDLAQQSAAEFAAEQSGSGTENPFVPITL